MQTYYRGQQVTTPSRPGEVGIVQGTRRNQTETCVRWPTITDWTRTIDLTLYTEPSP